MNLEEIKCALAQRMAMKNKIGPPSGPEKAEKKEMGVELRGLLTTASWKDLSILGLRWISSSLAVMGGT